MKTGLSSINTLDAQSLLKRTNKHELYTFVCTEAVGTEVLGFDTRPVSTPINIFLSSLQFLIP